MYNKGKKMLYFFFFCGLILVIYWADLGVNLGHGTRVLD